MKQTNLDIGNRIKYYREALAMTQEELALKVGYPLTHATIKPL